MNGTDKIPRREFLKTGVRYFLFGSLLALCAASIIKKNYYDCAGGGGETNPSLQRCGKCALKDSCGTALKIS